MQCLLLFVTRCISKTKYTKQSGTKASLQDIRCVSRGGGKTGLRGDKRSGLVHISTRTKKKKRKRGSYNGQHMYEKSKNQTDYLRCLFRSTPDQLHSHIELQLKA